MVVDFGAALCYIGIVWCLGQWTVSRIAGKDTEQCFSLLAFAVGFSELTLLSSFLYYTCRLPVQAVRAAWILLGLFALGALLKGGCVSRQAAAVLFGVTGLWLVMLLPGIIGGDQYYVYRGNCTDQQTYVEETVAVSMHSRGWYESRTREEIEQISDVLWRGYDWTVKDRPAAGTMIAVMRANPVGEIYWVVYLFRMFVQAIIMPSLLYLFHAVLKSTGKASFLQKSVWALAAALYCVGFWGQIQYDIDAVSQMSSIAVLTALTAVFIRYAHGLVENKNAVWDKTRYGMMVLLAAAGLALYLESALVHAALYLAAGLLLLLCFRRKLNGKEMLQLAGIPVISLGILILTNYRIVHFLMVQITTSVSDGRQAWANYFNEWWLGRHGIDDGRITGPVSRLVNCIISTSGMYNMTANYERYYGMTALILTGLAMLLAVLIVLCILRPVFFKTKDSEWTLWVIMFAGVMIVAGMCVGRKYWSAGKLLYYISPYLYAFLVLPALRVRECRKVTGKLALALAVLMLFSNGRMVLSRINDVRVNWACLGYRGTYPSDMIPGLKMTTDFTFDTKALAEADGVIIRDLSMVSDYQFYLQYLKVKLTCAGIPWTAEKDIDYYQREVEASGQRELTGNVAVLEAVTNENGRFEIVIRPAADS